jgi:hypothetical protein
METSRVHVGKTFFVPDAGGSFVSMVVVIIFPPSARVEWRANCVIVSHEVEETSAVVMVKPFVPLDVCESVGEWQLDTANNDVSQLHDDVNHTAMQCDTSAVSY